MFIYLRGSCAIREWLLPLDPEDLGLNPDAPLNSGEGNGNPLQYSCLENPMDREAWQATGHGVSKSWTGLSNSTTTTSLTNCWLAEKNISLLTWKIRRMTSPSVPGGWEVQMEMKYDDWRNLKGSRVMITRFLQEGSVSWVCEPNISCVVIIQQMYTDWMQDRLPPGQFLWSIQ